MINFAKWPPESCHDVAVDCQFWGIDRYLWIMHDGCNRDGIADLIGYDTENDEDLDRYWREDMARYDFPNG